MYIWFFRVTENTFFFKGVNALDASKKYEVTLNFYQSVVPQKVTSKNIGRCLEFTIPKQDCGPYWPTLTTDKTKLHFLKANFAKWRDESDDEEGMTKRMFDCLVSICSSIFISYILFRRCQGQRHVWQLPE